MRNRGFRSLDPFWVWIAGWATEQSVASFRAATAAPDGVYPRMAPPREKPPRKRRPMARYKIKMGTEYMIEYAAI